MFTHSALLALTRHGVLWPGEPDPDQCWHPPHTGGSALHRYAITVRHLAGQAGCVGKTQTNIVVVVVGRIVVAVGRAQVDRLIVPAAAAPCAPIRLVIIH